MLNLRFWQRWAALKKNKSFTSRPRLETLEDRTLLANSIVAENALVGTPQSTWDVAGGGSSNIVGFTDQISYNLGQTVNFKINTSSKHYRLEIYRMGYYQGNGARLITTIDKNLPSAQSQPAPLTDPLTNLQDYGNWGVSASWTIPTNLVSGLYFAKLVREDTTTGSNHVFFVVRNDASNSDLLFQTSDTTWEAYNSYGGLSLYDGNPGTRAFAVSYNRPFVDRTTAGGFGAYNWVMHNEYPMVRWLEANGYDVTYFTHVDSAARGTLIKNHKAFLSVGHDEYWANDEYNSVKAARDAGVNLAFFSGNEIFWKTRWASSIDGSNTPFRTLVCYKETFFGSPTDPLDPPLWTGTWMDPRFSPPADGGRPQNALTGQLFTINRGPTDLGTAIQVPASFSNLRFWRNTAVASLAPGQTLTLAPNTLGYEADSDIDNGFRPAGLFNLSFTSFTGTSIRQDYGGNYAQDTATHSLTLYRAASGALVFGAGTVQWAWGLDGTHDDGSSTPDVNMQQATVNLLADMNAQPGSLQPGLVATTASTDRTAPTSTIFFPAGGNTVVTNVPLTIYGTASDGGGGVVAAVEVSVDGGATWHRANGRNSWTYTWTPNTNGTAILKSRAVDDSGNLETPSAGVSVNVIGPLSLLDNQRQPDILNDPDSASIEVGMKFRSDVAGFISGVRFYKGLNNTGTHVGSLWSKTGTKLASATFTNETASGWQTVTFSTPVAISANTTYVVSYHANSGHYSDTGNFWQSTTTNGPLHGLASGVDGPNGVYAYSAGSTFPNQATNNPLNYFVDVLFSTSSSDVTSPEVQAVSPLPASTGVITSSTVTATFTESVVASSISFVLKNSSGATISASVSYDNTTHVATLTPLGQLAGNTTYTATVSGAKDAAGNTMIGSVSWSFTTGAALGNGPFSIWNSSATPAVVSDPDPNPIEVGLKFRSDVAGYVAGVRFYKGSTNTGTHVGSLWTSSGTKLGSVTFGSETASGWQQASFSSPIAIAPNTTYVISYHTNVGHYSDTSGAFTTAGVDNVPLHALADGVDGSNGVYAYSGSSIFPTLSFNATNYWVDVVFTPSAAPVVTSQTPAPGATGVSANTSVKATFNVSVQASTINFTLTDPANNPVPATLSYDDVTHTATLTPNAPLGASTTYTATVSGAQDLAGNPMTGLVSWSFTTGITVSSGIYSVFSSSATPAVISDPDSSAVELGMKFRSDVDGQILGIKFYKGSTNTGTHVGNLWTSTGTLLGSVTFSGESASGWQQANFTTPVNVTANTTYVVSYHTNVGHYSDTSGFFASGADNGPLHGLADGVDGPNGVYVYGAGSAFPTQTFNSTNYWVDVVFNVGSVTPTVVSETPAPGATNVAATSTVKAAFNESVIASTISFNLKDSSGTLVPASVSYDDATHTATLTPSANLAPSTTYVATVSGAKDANGNIMAAPVSWSFTTAAAPTVTSMTPAPSSTNVATTSTVQAVFSKAVVASTISFTLKDAANNPVAGSVSYNATTNTATFTPSALLATSTTFTATVSGAQDSSGNTMAPVSWSFTTETAPTVTSQTPAAGATNVATTSTVQAVFNKGIQASTLSFVLKDAGGVTVASTVAYNATTNTATLTPNALLATSTTFTATVSGAKDSSGNVMAPVSWSFTTEAAPALTSQTPASGATNVATTTTVQAVFSKAIQSSTVSFVLKDASGATVASTVAYNASTNTATLTPNALLATATTFTATVSGAKDTSGNLMAPVSWSFTTEAAPAVTSQTPASGATNVVTTSTVQAVFNKAVQSSTISFTLKDAANNPVSGTVAYTATTNTATFTPSALLATATTFTATVSGVKDSSGNLMAPLSWSFTTEAAPALTSQTPASGATNVVTTTTVKAVFNKAIQSSTLSFVLKDASGATVASTVAYNASTNTATLTPNALLATATTFTATVSGAKDASGNVMASTSWSFTTEAAPAVTSTTPAAGATNVATTTTVQAVFNKAVVASTISFVVKDPAGNPIANTVSYNNTTNTVTFTPSAALANSTTFTATVSGAKDSSGNVMAPVSWSFTTVAAPGPSITSTSPTSGATNVATNSPIKATFNVSVVASSISFVLKDAGGNPVTASLAYDDPTHVATLTPAALLSPSTTYTATVSGAKDSSGNVMTTTSWSFTTEAAPAVTSQTPASGATNVVTTSTVQAVFNKAVQSSTISFTLKDAANNPVAGTVAYTATTNTATFTPSALLATSTTFTATVSGAKDSSGNLMTPLSWSFTTEAAPALTSQTPASGATNVVTTTTVKAVFNKAIVASTLSFVVKDAAGNPVADTVSYDPATNTATFTPSALLATATTFTATVSGAKDASGNLMAPVSWSFTTEAAPAVTSQTPAPGATGVAASSVVKAVFNKSVVASSISFVLKDASGTTISASVAYDDPTHTATLTPSAPLATATTFTATVSGVKDASGNVLASPVSWSFTTDSSPAIISQTPSSGATNVATTSVVKATFNKSVVASSISFVLKDAAGNPVTASLAYDDPTHVATLTPAALLSPSTTYTATVSGAKDSSGNVMTTTSWSFTTEAAPAVTSQTPASGATNVATTTTVQAVFNKAVQSTTISFTLKDAANNPVAGTVAYNATTNTATFTPSALLATATTFTATVSGAKDSSGNTMTASSWSFTTEAAPALTSQSPASGANNVATTSVVKATFNKSVVASTISFVLKDAAGNPVTASVAYDDTTHGATLTPAAPLSVATTYTATVSGAKDTSGNTMATATWSFTTEAAPAVTSTTPAAGATNVAVSSTVKAVFNKSVVASSISFGLKDAAGTTVTATLAYDNTTFTATLTPAAALAASTTYTATVSGAKDSSGNVMTSPVSWSFTTGAATPAGLIAAYSFNEGSGTTVADSVKGHTGTITNATWTTAGKYGNALSFNGTSAWVTIADAADLDLSNAMTLEAWVQPTANATAWSAAIAKEQRSDPANDVAYSLYTADGASSPPAVHGLFGSGAGADQSAKGTSTLTLNTWTHLAGTYDGTALRLYVNGVLVATKAQTGSMTATADPLRIGGDFQNEFFKGLIDEVRVYNRALSQTEIQTDMATPLASNPVVTTQSPASGATGVATTSVVKATFNKAVVASTISFTLKDAAGTTVPATLTYDATSFTATLTPSAALATSTTYTAAVSGAQDSGGNVMTPVSWSFTTEAAPAVTSQTPAAGATNVLTSTTVKAVFNKSVVASSISFGLKDPSGNPVTASVTYDNTTFTATLTPSAVLATNTTYTATVSGVTDASGNVLASPVTWSFTTAAANAWVQSTANDFNAGTRSGTQVNVTPTPGVQLAPSFQDDFNGTALSSTIWSTSSYTSLGGGPLSVSVAGGLVSLAGGDVASKATYTPTTVAEGRINFGAATFQHFGLSTGFATTTGNYWAVFSTFNTTNTLYARVNRNGTTNDVSLGALPSGFHVYTVKPTATAFQFYVDGILQTTITATFPGTIKPKVFLTAFNGSPKPPIQADWIRVASYPASGTFTSSVFDSGKSGTVWGIANWTANLPAGTTLTVQTRSGNTATPDATWSAWTSVSNGGTVASPAGRYLQYQVTLTTTDATLTPTLFSITFNWT